MEEKKEPCVKCDGKGKIVYGSDTEGGRESSQCDCMDKVLKLFEPTPDVVAD